MTEEGTDDAGGQDLVHLRGSRGIGLAIALRAARDGANVALIAKTAEPVTASPPTRYGRGR
jgi:hypothetical protein